MEKMIHQLTNCFRCTDVRDEVKGFNSKKQFKKIILINESNNSICMQIYQFSLQIMYNPLKFTGLGLFYFGNSLLRNVSIYIYFFVFHTHITFIYIIS